MKKLILLVSFILITASVFCDGVAPEGNGTEESPYLVANIDNLLWISTNPSSWSSYFLQIAGIDASETQNWNNGAGFSPIGNYEIEFSGTFDGQLHILDGLYINRTDEDLIGFFGYVNNASIRNLNLEDINICGNNHVGGLSATSIESEITDCNTNGIVTGNGMTFGKIGGLIGAVSFSIINNCSSACDVASIASNRVGGLVGYNYHSEISYSFSSCNVTSNGEQIGGLVGGMESGGFVNNSYSSIGIISGSNYVGGLIGWCVTSNTEQTFSNCTVNGSETYIGGLIGFIMESDILNSYAKGNTTGSNRVGGFIGDTDYYSSIEFCYSTGCVTGDNYTGAFIGRNWWTEVNNCIWNIDTSCQEEGIGYNGYQGTVINLLGKTTEEMYEIDTYVDIGWDFVGEDQNGLEDIWDIQNSINDGFPFTHNLEYVYSQDELVADFEVDYPVVILGENIQFNDLSQGDITTWEWDFQNDGIIDTYDQNPFWTYEETGIYSVSLTVSNDSQRDSDTLIRENYIEVVEPLIADFSASVTQGTAPLEVEFTDQTNGFGCEWFWDFDYDGIVDSNEQNPTWIYEAPGTYTVSLEVVDVYQMANEIKEDYIVVENSSDFGVHNITTNLWYETIQEGINNSDDGDIIIIQPGTYFENINFNGKAITLGSLFHTTQDTAFISQTIINGNNSGSVVTFTNEEDSTSVLVGLTISEGSADQEGGGIYLQGCSPMISNCMIINNNADRYGGGVYCQYSSPVIQNCVISNNTSNLGGGGVATESESAPNLINCLVQNNSVLNNHDGGGLWSWNSSSNMSLSPILERCLITGNSAYRGGGIYCGNMTYYEIINTTISDNSSGIYCWGSPRTMLVNSICYGNGTDFNVNSSAVYAAYSCLGNNTDSINDLGYNFFSDPLFLSDENEYALQETSPCIDAGTAFYEYDEKIYVDYTDTQYNCAAPDIGWDETDIWAPLEADFSSDYTVVALNSTIQFYDLSSSQPNLWEWDFNNDGIIDSYDENPVHQFTEEGVYDVYLHVENAQPQESTIIKADYITVIDFGEYIDVPDEVETIQEAINFASEGTSILVQPGTYNESIDFIGKNISLISEFVITGDEDIIDQTIINGTGYHVVSFISGEDNSCSIDGFTITGGDANGYGLDNYGGGIVCSYASPTISNCIIRNNSVSNAHNQIRGGGVYLENSQAIIEFCHIYENDAISLGSDSSFGAGIAMNYSEPVIRYSTITDNYCDWSGGGISLLFSTLIMTNCTIGNNEDYLFSNQVTSYGSTVYNVNNLFLNSGEGQYNFNNNAYFANCYYTEPIGNDWGNNISENPMLIDPENMDYHLQPGSPCIDSGISYFENPINGEVLVDLSNELYYGEYPDIGAYETNYNSQLNAEFFAEVNLYAVNDIVQFTDTSTGDPTSWTWDFENDGIIDSYEQNPTYSYSSPGFYDVKLTVECNSRTYEVELKENYIEVVDVFVHNIQQDTYHLSLNDAIEYAVDGDTLMAGPRTYYELIDFDGKSITLASEYLLNHDSSIIEQTIIDGQSQKGHVVIINSNEGSDTHLCGFTIQGGFADGASYNDLRGGGIYCTSTPTISNCLIKNNTAQLNGGGVFCNADASFIDCVIENNNAYDGGGIYFYNCSAILSGCYIVSNSSSCGAGIYSDSGTSIYKNCTITDNVASYRGGGFFCYNSDSFPKLINTILYGNIGQCNNYYLNGGDIALAYSVTGGWQWDSYVDWGNNIELDPLLTDEYELSEDSPCIDVGTAYFEYEGEVLVDLAEDEYYGLAPDIGAYESNYTGEIIYGDIDDNSEVESYDVSLILMNLVNMDPIPEDPVPWEDWRFTRADVDLDGELHAVDGAYILQYVIGIRDSLPVYDPFRSGCVVAISNDNEYLYLDIEGEAYGIEYQVTSTLNLELAAAELLNSECLCSQEKDKLALSSAQPLSGKILRIPFTRNVFMNAELEMNINLDGKRQQIIYELTEQMPEATQLNSVYPNPFNPSTTIRYQLAKAELVQIEVYNIKGQNIAILISQQQNPGSYELCWQPDDQPSGVYLLRFKAGSFSDNSKLILLK